MSATPNGGSVVTRGRLMSRTTDGHLLEFQTPADLNLGDLYVRLSIFATHNMPYARVRIRHTDGTECTPAFVMKTTVQCVEGDHFMVNAPTEWVPVFEYMQQIILAEITKTAPFQRWDTIDKRPTLKTEPNALLFMFGNSKAYAPWFVDFRHGLPMAEWSAEAWDDFSEHFKHLLSSKSSEYSRSRPPSQIVSGGKPTTMDIVQYPHGESATLRAPYKSGGGEVRYSNLACPDDTVDGKVALRKLQKRGAFPAVVSVSIRMVCVNHKGVSPSIKVHAMAYEEEINPVLPDQFSDPASATDEDEYADDELSSDDDEGDDNLPALYGMRRILFLVAMAVLSICIMKVSTMSWNSPKDEWAEFYDYAKEHQVASEDFPEL